MKERLTWMLGIVGYTAAALIFLYTTFVTAAYLDRFESALDKRLARIEHNTDQTNEKLDQILLRRK